MKPLELWFSKPQDADLPRVQERFIPLLTPEERSRYQEIHHDSDRGLYLLAHSLMRVSLQPHAKTPLTDWSFTRKENGKPCVRLGPGSAPDFSLSHTAGMVVCAVSERGRIGIDVEPVKRGRNALRLASRWFTESENKFLERLDVHLREQAAIWIWTAKEALVKATGEGIEALSTFSVYWPTRISKEVTTNHPSPWTLRRFRLGDDFLGTIALEGCPDPNVLPTVFRLRGGLETPHHVQPTEVEGVLQVETEERF